MEMEAGKLFIGGISWETNEERLREYFQAFGEIVEAVIMRDRATGRARGFGFVVFADASVAVKVVREKHIIDGRSVEAKKAVPRNDRLNSNRNNGSIRGSLGPAHTKKIFVGGLASTVTESDFKTYFERFGTITDVVVMYDHNTQRPRGFGFITYDSEEAADKVLLKTFHEIHGKMVEVKRAVPKELSPGPTRSLSSSYNNGLSRASSFLNAYIQGYLSNSSGGHGMRTDGRLSPATLSQIGYPPYSPGNHSTVSNLDTGFSSNYGTFRGDSGLGYGHVMNSYFSQNSNLNDSPISYGGSGGNGSFLNAANGNMWSNGNVNYNTNSLMANDFVNSGSGNAGVVGRFGSIGEIWGCSPASTKGGRGGSLSNENIVHGQGDNNVGGWAGYVRNYGGTAGTASSHAFTNDVRDRGIGNLYGGDLLYEDRAWHTLSPELKVLNSFGYAHRSAAAEVTPNNSVGYSGTHSVSARSNRGIAA